MLIDTGNLRIVLSLIVPHNAKSPLYCVSDAELREHGFTDETIFSMIPLSPKVYVDSVYYDDRIISAPPIHLFDRHQLESYLGLSQERARILTGNQQKQYARQR